MELLKIVIFRVENRHFAIFSKNVKEIIDSASGVNPVFYGGKALKGIMSFGSDLISVLDSHFLLGLGNDRGEQMILVCKEKEMEKPVGITVSAVKGMEIVSLSSVISAQGNDEVYISGLIAEVMGGKEIAVPLLDLRRFLDFAETRIEKL